MDDTEQIVIKDLFIEIFNLRYYFVVLLLLITSSAFYFIFNSKPIYEGSLNLKKINIQQNEKYNNFKLISSNSDRAEILEKEEIISITPEYLQELVIDEILDRQEVKNGITKIILNTGYNFTNEQERENYIKTKSNKFQVFKGSEIKNTKLENIDVGDYTVIYSSEDTSEIFNIIEYVLDEANKNTKEFLINKFNNFYNSYNFVRLNRLEDIDRLIQSSIDDYNYETEKRIAYLSEQAEIAQNLNIVDNTFKVSDINDPAVEAVDEELSLIFRQNLRPFYMNGVKAINTEIDLLKNRKNIEPFVTNLYELRKEKSTLEENVFLKRLSRAFEETPIAQENFYTLNYDIAKIKFKQINTSTIQVIIYSILLFIVLSILILFIRIISNIIKS